MTPTIDDLRSLAWSALCFGAGYGLSRLDDRFSIGRHLRRVGKAVRQAYCRWRDRDMPPAVGQVWSGPEHVYHVQRVGRGPRGGGTDLHVIAQEYMCPGVRPVTIIGDDGWRRFLRLNKLHLVAPWGEALKLKPTTVFRQTILGGGLGKSTLISNLGLSIPMPGGATPPPAPASQGIGQGIVDDGALERIQRL